jgi:hypothetical protein
MEVLAPHALLDTIYQAALAHHVLRLVTVTLVQIHLPAQPVHQDIMHLPVLVTHVLLLLLGVVHVQIVQHAQPAHLDTT